MVCSLWLVFIKVNLEFGKKYELHKLKRITCIWKLALPTLRGLRGGIWNELLKQQTFFLCETLWIPLCPLRLNILVRSYYFNFNHRVAQSSAQSCTEYWKPRIAQIKTNYAVLEISPPDASGLRGGIWNKHF